MMISNTTCTGCGACSITCPVHCIKMELDRLGHIAPVIDRSKCIHCGQCRAICPQNQIPQEHFPTACYAAWSTCTEDYTFSASGGAAAAFARYQLKQGGTIFGCDYDEYADLRHFQLHDENDVHRMQSSKYSQSMAFDSFFKIKELLERQISVVFIGTPCQVAGLLRFLKKDYPFLITIDLVCHGAPPDAYLKEYLSELGLTPPYQRIRFRGEFDQMLTVWKDDSIVYQKSQAKDDYFSAFYQNVISCDSCFSCQYAQPKRVSDITIGDFWGLGELNEIKALSDRPSLILLNTEKGQTFFDRAKCNLIFEQRSVAEGICGNGRLNAPPGKNYKAKSYQFLYRSHILGFQKSVKATFLLSKVIDFFGRLRAQALEYKAALHKKISKIKGGGDL